MSHGNNFPIVLQRYSFTFAGTCAYRSSHFAVAVKARVQAAVRVIADERKLIDTADIGISRDYNLSVPLHRHTVAKGATLSSDGCLAEGDETCARMEDEEPRGSFHFTRLKSMRENKQCHAPQKTESKASALFGSQR